MEGPVNPINNDNVIPNQFDTAVPTKISTWTKIKNFLFQEITVELTPKQEATFKAINDFWHQEIDENQGMTFRTAATSCCFRPERSSTPLTQTT